MSARDGLDGPATARIARWLPEFRGASARTDDWADRWTEVLAASAKLDPADDAAAIRDHRPHGYPTHSLLYCVANIGHTGVTIDEAELAPPGRWG